MGKDWDKAPTISTSSAVGEDSDIEDLEDTDEEILSSEDVHAMEAFHIAWLKEAFRILKPGGIAKVFSATRTLHRLAAAMENVGFLLEPETSVEAWCYACLSENTEILTKDGWKLGVDVVTGEQVACWDPQTGKMEIASAPVLQTTRAPFSGNMVRFFNGETDQLVTPNHRVYHWQDNAWVVSLAGSLVDQEIEVPLPVGLGKTTVIGKLEPYEGLVWCVQVSTGAFVARRYGKIFITGNSGFPKSLSISKSIDKLLGREREGIGYKQGVGGENLNDLVHGAEVIRSTDEEGGKGVGAYGTGAKQVAITIPVTAPASEEAKTFSGFGSALKPAWEPFIVGRKPL